MHEAVFPSAPPSEPAPAPGVYAHLPDLIRLQYQARGFSFLPRQPVHSILSGRHSSRVRGRGVDFEEIRRYSPGDDIRDMDWRVTARLGKPHVRVYTEERDRPVLLLIDQRQTMFFGSKRAMKSVAAAEAAALAAWRTFDVGDRVGAVVFGDTDIVELRPQRSRAQVMRILEAVVRLNAALRVDTGKPANAGMFNEALRRATRLATHDFLVCTVSDGFGVNAESRRLGTRVAAHNDVLVLFIYDPIEANLPSAGPLVFGQADLQLEVDTGSARLRRDYAAEFAERQAAIEQFCRQRTTPRLSISTDRDVAEQVRERLGHVPGPHSPR
jgi:uncharacterized protein (DUF58 family)